MTHICFLTLFFCLGQNIVLPHLCLFVCLLLCVCYNVRCLWPLHVENWRNLQARSTIVLNWADYSTLQWVVGEVCCVVWHQLLITGSLLTYFNYLFSIIGYFVIVYLFPCLWLITCTDLVIGCAVNAVMIDDDNVMRLTFINKRKFLEKFSLSENSLCQVIVHNV